MVPKLCIELSGSHGGNLQNCLTLIRHAKLLKPASIKFQAFDPEELAEKRLGNPAVIEALGGKPTLDELIALYRQTVTPREWWGAILEELAGFPWSCSVFSLDDLRFVLGLGCPSLKVASFELTDLSLIRACAATGKPLVLSASAFATTNDIMDAIEAAEHAHELTLLHASKYSHGTMDAEALQNEMDDFDVLQSIVPPLVQVGLSDHTPGCQLAEYVAIHGATMIERHMRLPDIETPDSEFSLTPTEMLHYREAIEATAKSQELAW